MTACDSSPGCDDTIVQNILCCISRITRSLPLPRRPLLRMGRGHRTRTHHCTRRTRTRTTYTHRRTCPHTATINRYLPLTHSVSFAQWPTLVDMDGRSLAYKHNTANNERFLLPDFAGRRHDLHLLGRGTSAGVLRRSRLRCRGRASWRLSFGGRNARATRYLAYTVAYVNTARGENFTAPFCRMYVPARNAAPYPAAW